MATSTAHKANSLTQSFKRDFRLVRLRWDQFEDDGAKTLGVFVARMKEGLATDKQGFAAYFIAHIRQDGLVWR